MQATPAGAYAECGGYPANAIAKADLGFSDKAWKANAVGLSRAIFVSVFRVHVIYLDWLSNPAINAPS